ncbi:amino acid ABC transporter permease [Hydrogenophaga borbori]|uniref:amino acid ABC transporter permease n=1 Tax=Hydrogenophaga TaxID=47420 RepID=UPI0009651D1B|nr:MULTISPECIES: amino acid ABC transporter permease [unclassified Hydrogenophaga]MBN9373555.1 amino acid ABC transporter permease [Hydrogenophaga sp.]OJV42714.1 MAG: amino acid ABC transporter permease [Hydrogenophaga sp. 70-12]
MPTFGLVHVQFLLQGALWTVALSACAFIGGGLMGLLIALCRVSRFAWLRAIAAAYIQIVQGVPLLVIMFAGYFGLPALGLAVSPLMAATLSMTIWVGAYLGEFWRGSIQSVPKAQWEAAECLALSRTQRMFKVIIPQAIRNATPGTVGFMVQIVKNTSLASAVSFVDLTRAGQLINNSTFQPFITFVVVALIYFLLCYPLSALSRRLEQRMARGMRSA